MTTKIKEILSHTCPVCGAPPKKLCGGHPPNYYIHLARMTNMNKKEVDVYHNRSRPRERGNVSGIQKNTSGGSRANNNN